MRLTYWVGGPLKNSHTTRLSKLVVRPLLNHPPTILQGMHPKEVGLAMSRQYTYWYMFQTPPAMT